MARTNATIQLLYQVAVTANEAISVDEALQTAVSQICAYTDWPIGHVYKPAEDGSGEIAPTDIWCLDNVDRFQAFYKATMTTHFVPGRGLVGRVFQSGRPTWMADLTQKRSFIRSKQARSTGIQTGLAFPVLVGKEVVAVMEFFSGEVEEPDEILLEVMGQIGTQLGRVVERARAEEALRESEHRTRLFLNTALDAVVTVDDRGLITGWNDYAEQIFGWSGPEILGQPLLTTIVPPQYREAYTTGFDRFLKLGERRILNQRIEITALHRSGHEFPVELTVAPVMLRGRYVFNAFIRDITERKQVELNLLRRAQQQAAVADLGQHALADVELLDLLDRAVTLVAQTLDVECCEVLELLPGGASLLLRAGVGWREGVVGRAIVWAGDYSQAGYALSEQTPVIVEDLSAETRFSRSDLLYTHEVVSGMSVIIPGKNRPFGVLGAHSKKRRKFTQHDLNFLQGVANVLAEAVERKRMEEALATSAEVGRQVTTILDLDELLQSIVVLIQQSFGYETVILKLLEPAENALAFKAAAGVYADRFTRERYQSLHVGLMGAAAREGKTLLVNDVSQDPRYIAGSLPETKSELVIPLKFRDSVIGVLSIRSQFQQAFSDRDALAIEALGHQIAAAIENASLFKKEQRQREIATILAEVVALVGQNLSRDELLNHVLLKLRKLIPYDSAAIFLIQADDLVIEAVHGVETTVIGERHAVERDVLFQEMVDRKSHILIRDTLADSRYQRWSGVEQARSWLATPLWMAKVIIGYLSIDRREVDAFTAVDADLIQAFAYQAAQAIYNARLVADLGHAQAQLVQRERLAALGQMAATVAHELRNPLMAIRMGVEYLVRDIAEGDSRRHGAALMQNSMDRIDRIVEDILFISRVRQAHLSPGWLRPILEEEIARWQADLAEKRAICEVDLADGLPAIQLDSHQVSRLLSNLIANSVDALSPGGKLFLSLKRQGGNQIVVLADSGPGIPPEHLPRIFEPFFTTRTRGTGLGLSIVKQIVDYHAGSIEVASKIGQGTTFKITFPER
ncbi:MAG: GAF domain-containing protein [Chloroflexi bacterium]|nr:GAF domain-containing protein [Chloroflexota bacterium]MCI0575190.1 GAF domain-containing protein [Chloroflexota bacterium]MCI0647128.1 GAF domain-containing protein [Chloroflexota bacterium]MCI0729996.1 GAF domain-containing protein [Chloroflexota bacterium]